MKALLVILLTQLAPDGPPVTAAPTILYFSSYDLCEKQKDFIVQSIIDTANSRPRHPKIVIAAQCNRVESSY